MEMHDLQSAIDDVARLFADRRVNIFEIEPALLDSDQLHLRGRVLDETNRLALVSNLMARFPDLQVDASGVEVLRQTPPQLMAVGTNLTSVHDGTSFLAEMVTQMLNGVPVEILKQEKNWVYIRQPDGYLGWTYRPYLNESAALEPTHLVVEPVGLLKEAPELAAPLVTRVFGGTFVHAEKIVDDWAWLTLVGGAQGWLPLNHLRTLAALPQTVATRRAQMVEDAFRLIGVPYLWGGCSANGIDCSGYAQLLHRWVGLTIPRDADMQFAAGRPVEPPFHPGDLLFFGERGEQRRITHVTVSLGGWNVIHSSRSRNGVQVDDVQAVPGLRDSYLCAATFIDR